MPRSGLPSEEQRRYSFSGPSVVFGASGFIGSHLVEVLHGQGQTVIAPVRTPNTWLAALGVRQVRLDFTDDAALTATMTPGVTVYCCLANPRRHLALAELRAVEVGLTGRVIRAAARANARRVVLLSSVMVQGFERPWQAIDEHFPVAPHYPFCQVALEREEAARATAAAVGIELAMLRPAYVLGARDRQMAPLFQAARQGLFPRFGCADWPFSAIDARDAGHALHLLADLPLAAGGDVWLAKGFDTSWAELQEVLARLIGRRLHALRLPRRLALGLGAVLESVVPYGIEPPLTRFAVEVMASPMLFDCQRITAAGFAPRYGLADAVAEALR
jgi:nucleoside-diphosphate-sugar epimerase